MIPGAKVTIANPLGVALSSTSADAQGVYSVVNLPAGGYIVEANVNGFAPFSSATLQVAAGQLKRVDITMAVLAEQQNVVVTDESGPMVSVDAESNASAMVLKGQDLDALSDDPDELQSELSALAGPAAGPNGGQIYIDGFTGGTLPPKSAIREIRINQNPFSAEFDHIGYGRIEILTKPGTDKLHVRAFLQGNDDVFNTGSPFSPVLPAYHSIQYNGTVSGSLSKSSSFFLSIEGRNTQDASVYTVDLPQQNTAGQWYINNDSSGNVIPTTGGLLAPTQRFEISPRFDFQLGQKNTLTARLQYERGTSSGNIGSTSTPNQSTSSTSSEIALQASDSYVINEHMVNETRIQLRRAISTSTPVSTAPTISVSGLFTDGGASGQYSGDHSDHIELQNVTTMSAGAHAIKFGGWLRDNRDANSSNSGFNGTFTFNTSAALQNYVYALNHPSAPGPSIYELSYTSGNTKFSGNVFDAAAFFQDDWKVNRLLTLSGGLRFESQNHMSDHADFAPRLAFAYALDGHKKGTQTKSVVRGGYGFFYDRFNIGSLMGLERNNVDNLNGTNIQKQSIISTPSCFSTTTVSTSYFANCGSSSSTVATAVNQQLDPSYHSPVSEQLGVSLERQLNKAATITATYIHTFGVHQSATRNSNAYEQGTYVYGTPSGTLPNASLGVVNEIYPEAVFKQNQLIVNVNGRLSQKFSVMGFYTLNAGNSNSGTASNSWNLSQDYGRAGFIRRNQVFLMANYTGPWGITFNPMMQAMAGHPYNIVTSNDLNGDKYLNDRPGLVSTGNCSGASTRYYSTSYGCLDVTPAQGESILPVNDGNGPAAVMLNLRVSRSFGVGPKIGGAGQGQNGQRQQAGSYMGGGGPGGPGGGPGGGGMRGGGGGRGGPGGGVGSTGHKYSLNFSAQAINLFNDYNYSSPNGTVGSQMFGKSTSIFSGIGASSAATRRIFIMAAFSF